MRSPIIWLPSCLGNENQSIKFGLIINTILHLRLVAFCFCYSCSYSLIFLIKWELYSTLINSIHQHHVLGLIQLTHPSRSSESCFSGDPKIYAYYWRPPSVIMLYKYLGGIFVFLFKSNIKSPAAGKCCTFPTIGVNDSKHMSLMEVLASMILGLLLDGPK